MKVEFHTGVVDKLGAACRFLRNAHAAGAAVVVCGEGTVLDRLDSLLWTFEPLSFVPHLRLRGASCPPALARTPIWLVNDAATVAARQVLLNVGLSMVEGWNEFERVVELVSADADDVSAGRKRWRHYEACPGIHLVHPTRAAGS